MFDPSTEEGVVLPWLPTLLLPCLGRLDDGGDGDGGGGGCATVSEDRLFPSSDPAAAAPEDAGNTAFTPAVYA